jgi:hypothetical protein
MDVSKETSMPGIHSPSPLPPARPPGQTAQAPAWQPPAPPRPDSPTYLNLKSLADQERQGVLAVPVQPAQVRRATIEEWGAVQAFKQNMDNADPSGRLRREGEFFQTFTSKPAECDYVANHPIHYQPGRHITAPPTDAFPPGTTEMVHSHPHDAPGRISNFPSAQDYLGTYQINEGNARGMGGIMYHAGEDRAYAFSGKLNPETDAPEFHRLTPPSFQDNTAWMIKHGHLPDPGI